MLKNVQHIISVSEKSSSDVVAYRCTTMIEDYISLLNQNIKRKGSIVFRTRKGSVHYVLSVIDNCQSNLFVKLVGGNYSLIPIADIVSDEA
jgi:hypothetical protein